MAPNRTHASRHYEEQIQELRAALLKMGGRVEERIRQSIDALVKRDDDLARGIILSDTEIDLMEKEIDERCLELLALRQPAASDLRFIAASLKIVTDLERIGDHLVNICERTLDLNRSPQLKPYIDIPRMAGISQQMVSCSLDAFVRGDDAAALRIVSGDDVVDGLTQQIFKELLTYMLEDSRTISRATALIFIAEYLERIADHATNIAEQVVFVVKGQDIRHEDLPAPS